MSERRTQARTHAKAMYPDLRELIERWPWFLDGMAWADANPKPTTITHDDIDAAYAVFMEAEGHPVRRFIVALKAIGIEVEDDDE